MLTRYRHLAIQDRIEIEKLLDSGYSQTMIAAQLGCHRSTISREIRRRSWSPERVHANLRPYLRNKLDTRMPRGRIYLAEQAQHHATKRQVLSHQPYRMSYDPLVHHVFTRLRDGWTPEEIGGRLPHDFPDDPRMRVSHETLYAWIYGSGRRGRQLWQYLPRGHKKRRKRAGRRVQTDRIRWRVSIHDRPLDVESRTTFGHWESDSIVGSGHSGGIHTSVERQSRFVCGAKIPAITAEATWRAQYGMFSLLPAHAVASITADNGSEFAFHHTLADTMGVPTYFCDPYSSFQRGTNEHFNGRIRRYLPKGTSFDDVTQEELDEYITEINNRPRKVLGWLTPAEVFQELCSKEAIT